MPLQRRLPKRGFKSLTRARNYEVRLTDLDRLPIDAIDLLALQAAGIVPGDALSAKVILSGAISRKVTLKGVGATKVQRLLLKQSVDRSQNKFGKG